MTNVDLTKPKIPTTAPKFLDNYGKRLWSKLASYLNKNSKVIMADQYLLQQYCSLYTAYRKADQSIKEDGVLLCEKKTKVSPTTGEIKDTEKKFKPNPAYKILSDSVAKLNAIGRELGLSPKARSEMLALATDNRDEKSVGKQIEEFFNK